MREKLIRLAIRYRGDYTSVKRALRKKENPPDCELQKAITILDDEYPEELRQLKKPPFVLFYEGNKELLRGRKAAVVGSRLAKDYAIKATEDIVEKMNGQFVIVSGMAKGIDAVAHWKAERSIGILGNGLNVVYPKENRDLYDHMRKNGLLLTEYPEDVEPRKEHFPFRNRIIAALAEAVIVTQASNKSGTMLTVNEALNLGKDIYTIPYRLTDKEGTGCNKLIQQGAFVILSEEK